MVTLNLGHSIAGRLLAVDGYTKSEQQEVEVCRQGYHRMLPYGVFLDSAQLYELDLMF